MDIQRLLFKYFKIHESFLKSYFFLPLFAPLPLDVDWVASLECRFPVGFFTWKNMYNIKWCIGIKPNSRIMTNIKIRDNFIMGHNKAYRKTECFITLLNKYIV